MTSNDNRKRMARGEKQLRLRKTVPCEIGGADDGHAFLSRKDKQGRSTVRQKAKGYCEPDYPFKFIPETF